jgi:hypothetical protein
MKKPTTKKLSVSTTTVRALQSDQLAQVQGGSVSVQSVSVIRISGTSVISYNPSGG